MDGDEQLTLDTSDFDLHYRFANVILLHFIPGYDPLVMISYCNDILFVSDYLNICYAQLCILYNSIECSICDWKIISERTGNTSRKHVQETRTKKKERNQ